MDDRQTEIRAGAGLEDSRVNKEFIDFLNKWSSPVILVFAVAALVWAGLGKLEQMKIAKIDSAFGELQAATIGGNPSPASLNTIAEEYAGIKAVPEIAKLTTADLYLNAYISGIQPGATLSPLTGQPEETDILDDAQRQVYLDQAQTLANDVISISEKDEGKVLLTIHGLIRAGAVAECKRDFDTAKSHYNRVITLANDAQLPALAYFGQTRIDAVDTFDQALALPSNDDLVPLPGEEPAEESAVTPAITPEVIDPSANPPADPSADPLSEAETIIDSAIESVNDASEDLNEAVENLTNDLPDPDAPESDNP